MDTGRDYIYWSSKHAINRAALSDSKLEVLLGKLCTVLYTHALMSLTRFNKIAT